MSTSPPPSDPYECLGVSKDADSEGIKKAHRKLALKHHPDRIKDPALVEQNKNEFQKVQQAYELLIDPLRRARYDDECKLAQLRRERMTSEPPRPSEPVRPTYTKTYYSARSTPAAPPTPNAMPRDMPREMPRDMPREMKTDARYDYEERVPESYFELNTSRDRFDEPTSRASARKPDTYERRTSAHKPSEKKEKSKSSAWDRPAGGIPLKFAFHMKDKAEKFREKAREREVHAKTAKARDKEERTARSEKEYSNTRYAPRVDDCSDDGSSDSDTVVAHPRRPVMRETSSTSKPKRTVTPEPPLRRHPSPRRGHVYEEEPDRYDHGAEDDKWEIHHRASKEYQNESRKTRPPLSRNGSDIHTYWSSQDVTRDVPRDIPRDVPRESHRDSPRNSARDSARDRRSGSDSDKRPSTSSKPARRSVQEESRHRPSLPTQSSAPAGFKSNANTPEREPLSRSRQNSYNAVPPHRREMPELRRVGSDPVPKSGPKRDNAPPKGSNLKQSETHHDSGYGSSSNPQTPEIRGDSPPREGRTEAKPRETSTKYKVQKDELNEDTRRARKIIPDNDYDVVNSRDMPTLRKFLSPEDAVPDRRDRDRERERHHHHHHSNSEERHERRSSRSRDREPRSRSSRPGESLERRPSISRAESNTRYEERPRRLYKEISPDRSYTRKVDPATVKTANYRTPSALKYSSYDDYYPSHRSVREPRRTSAMGMV